MNFIPKPDFSAGWYVAAALGILILPLRWLLAVCIATAVHEFGHLAALKAQDIPIHTVTVHFGGVSIGAGFMTLLQERIAAAAGPVVSLLLLFWVRWYPELAFCGLCQGLFNLLPVYPFDGGRICGTVSGLPMCCVSFLQALAYLVAGGCGLWAAVLFPRWIPCILGATVGILLRLGGNTSCKDSVLAVQ